MSSREQRTVRKLGSLSKLFSWFYIHQSEPVCFLRQYFLKCCKVYIVNKWIFIYKKNPANTLLLNFKTYFTAKGSPPPKLSFALLLWLKQF